jgi:hypothetical protein
MGQTATFYCCQNGCRSYDDIVLANAKFIIQRITSIENESGTSRNVLFAFTILSVFLMFVVRVGLRAPRLLNPNNRYRPQI